MLQTSFIWSSANASTISVLEGIDLLIIIQYTYKKNFSNIHNPSTTYNSVPTNNAGFSPLKPCIKSSMHAWMTSTDEKIMIAPQPNTDNASIRDLPTG